MAGDRVRTAAKWLALRKTRREAYVEARRLEVAWWGVEDRCAALYDPEAIDLAVAAGLSMTAARRRLEMLDEDCAEATA
jgi:hypothetical protein